MKRYGRCALPALEVAHEVLRASSVSLNASIMANISVQTHMLKTSPFQLSTEDTVFATDIPISRKCKSMKTYMTFCI